MDCLLTSVIDETQVKVVAWYDNEWGYSTRLVELAERVMGPVHELVSQTRSGGGTRDRGAGP